MRMERGLGVEHQLHLRRCRHLTVDGCLRGNDVLDEVATVLGLVSNRLAQPAGDGQQRELAHGVLVGGCRRGRRRRWKITDRQATQQHRTGLVGIVGEVDERIVDRLGHRPGGVPGRTHEHLVAGPIETEPWSSPTGEIRSLPVGRVVSRCSCVRPAV